MTDSDIQPDPYIDAMAAEHVQEYEPHWLTQWDPDDGEPYGTVCDCDIDQDHDGNGDPFP